jgi:hypothetical protein
VKFSSHYTTAIGGRLRKNSEGSLSSTREKGYGLSSVPNAAAFQLNVAVFPDIVKNPPNSILPPSFSFEKMRTFSGFSPLICYNR